MSLLDSNLGKMRKYIVFTFLILLFLVILFVSLKKQETEPVEEVKKEEIELQDNKSKIEETVEETYISGAEVIAAYKKIEGTDYAFLVATQSFLETDLFDLMESPEYSYLVYVLSLNDLNIAETIYSRNGLEVNLAFVNYNRVLNDTCLIKKVNGLFYETDAGYREEDGESKIQTFLYMNELNDVFKINGKSKFIEREIYNANGKVIGCTYIEK